MIQNEPLRKSNIVKYAQQVNSPEYEQQEQRVAVRVPKVIKRQYIAYSYEQKYQLGILTPYEYAAWQMELIAEASKPKADEQPTQKKTFWEGEGDRKNIADDEYQKLLAQTGINVANRNAIDVDAIMNQQEDNAIDQALADEVARIQAKFMPIQGDIDSLFSAEANNPIDSLINNV